MHTPLCLQGSSWDHLVLLRVSGVVVTVVILQQTVSWSGIGSTVSRTVINYSIIFYLVTWHQLLLIHVKTLWAGRLTLAVLEACLTPQSCLKAIWISLKKTCCKHANTHVYTKFKFTVYNSKDLFIAFVQYTSILDSYQYSSILSLPSTPEKAYGKL